MVMDTSEDKVNIDILNIFRPVALQNDCLLSLGFWSSMEHATGIDLNGDGLIGRPFDVMPRYAMTYSYPSIGYSYRTYPIRIFYAGF